MDAFICPVTQDIMTDPVSAPCGHTFDRSTLQNIEAHRSTHGEWRCPSCRESWHHSFTSEAPTNYALKGAIEAALGAGTLQRSPSGPGTAINNGPCFLADGHVQMTNGTTKRIDQLRAGDLVAGNHRVRCVLKTEVNRAMIVRLGEGPGCGFTENHPVRFGGAWYHPHQLKPSVDTRTDAVYNFVLDTGHILVINGVETCTMGHDFEGPVISHPYFGKRVPGLSNILDDLAVDPGWADGYVTWRNVHFAYNPQNGYIMGLAPV
jgi:hypothetical protein